MHVSLPGKTSLSKVKNFQPYLETLNLLKLIYVSYQFETYLKTLSVSVNGNHLKFATDTGILCALLDYKYASVKRVKAYM